MRPTLRTWTIVLAVVAVSAIAYSLFVSGPKVPEGSVLSIRLGGQIMEAPATDAVSQFLATGPALPTLLLQFEKAAADERIAAVLFHVRPLTIGFARLQELRDGLAELRAAGKKIIVLLELGGFNATRELYLASAATEVYVVPGYLGPLAGISGQYVHMARFLDRIGVQFEYERIGAYKSAPEMFAGEEMSAPAREKANELLDGIYEQLVDGLATGRDLEPGAVRRLIEKAPGTAHELTTAGLIDGVAGRSEVLERANLADAEEVTIDDYLHVDPRDLGLRGGPRIGLVFGDGLISSEGGRGRGSPGFGADRVAQALESAEEDESIVAVVLRINSGGGEVVASDRLWRAVRSVREKKPIVVSMADAAASGGYYIASAANAIVAQPTTLTGSIGVFVLRPATAGLYDKLQIGREEITRGAFAPVSSGGEPLTEEQRERAKHFVRTMYDDFLARVSEGRDIDTEKVDSLGQGQVWLGEAALGHGLVDEIGGLRTAITLAKREAGIDDDVDPVRVVLPGARGLRQQMRDLISGELRAWLVGELVPVELPRFFDALGLALDGGVAYLPTWWIEIR